MHLSPSSISTWARLGADAADAAASHTQEALSSANTPSVSAKLAEACLSAAEKHAMFCLLAKARDAGGGGGGTSGVVVAQELAASLSGIAKAVMCGGECVGNNRKSKTTTKGKSEVGVGKRASRSVRATSRAVHLYPGDTLAWRCLAAALVSSLKSSTFDLNLGLGAFT